MGILNGEKIYTVDFIVFLRIVQEFKDFIIFFEKFVEKNDFLIGYF